MGILSRLTSLRGSQDDERPPKPEDEQREEKIERDVYRVTVEYRNGDTETFDTYGRYNTGSHKITYNVELQPKTKNYSDPGDAAYTYDRRRIHWGVLARDPVEERVGTETWRLTWIVTYQEKTKFGEFVRWEPHAENPELERIEPAD